jgi:hypothetical protein
MGFSTRRERVGSDIVTVQAGSHPVMITKAYQSVSQSGNEMICLEYTVLAGKSKGGTIRDYIPHVEAWYGVDKLLDLCESIGVVGDDDDPENGLDPYSTASCHKVLLGKMLAVDCTVEGYTDANGEDRKSAKVKPGGIRALQPAFVDQMAMRYRATDGHPPLPDDCHMDFYGEPLMDVEIEASGQSDDGWDNSFAADDDIPF